MKDTVTKFLDTLFTDRLVVSVFDLVAFSQGEGNKMNFMFIEYYLGARYRIGVLVGKNYWLNDIYIPTTGEYRRGDLTSLITRIDSVCQKVSQTTK